MKRLLLIALLLFKCIAYTQTNLIKNGGFESELSYWRGDDVATISPYDKKTGKNSCTINQYVGEQWKGIDQIVTLPKNTVALELSGWVKSDGVEKGKNEWNAGKFDIEFLSSGEKGIQNESIVAVIGTTPWTFYQKRVYVPDGASKLRIMLALGQTNGTLFFDDIKAAPITQEQLNKFQEEENIKRMAAIEASKESKVALFTNGDFENGNTAWRGNVATSNTVTKEGKAALMLQSSTFDWNGIDQIADVPENATTITISGWLKSEKIQQGKDTWNNGLLNIAFTGNDNQKTGDDQNISFVTGTTDWTFYTKTFPLPSGTKKYRIMVALGFATGTLYADAISVTFN